MTAREEARKITANIPRNFDYGSNRSRNQGDNMKQWDDYGLNVSTIIFLSQYQLGHGNIKISQVIDYLERDTLERFPVTKAALRKDVAASMESLTEEKSK